MKKFLAFLLAFSVCLVCFGTYGFENAAIDTHDACDHDHSHSGHAVLAADDDTESLYAEITGSAYNETLQTLTVTFSVGSKTGNKISGGTVVVTAPVSTLERPTSVSGYLFGEFLSQSAFVSVAGTASASTVTITIPDVGKDSRSPTGSFTITYPVDTEWIDLSFMRIRELTVSGAAKKADGTSFGFDSQTTTHNVYICNHSSTNSRVTKEATCTTTGTREQYCTTCGYVVKTETLLLTDHDFDYSKRYTPSQGQDATCTVAGYGYYKCKLCGTISWTLAPATGHTWGARYLENGVYKQKCTVCGQVSEADNQCAHDSALYTLKRVVTASTCTTKGSAVYECPTCGATETRELPLADHAFGEWTVTVQAGCTISGSRYHRCSVCDDIETEIIAPLGHSWGAWTITKEATCISTGTRSRVCVVCGDVDTETIAQSGHSWSSYVTTKEATCVSTGTERRTCSLCGEVDTQTIPLASHTYGAWAVTAAPTCKAAGTEERVCSVCGDRETRTAALDPNAHSYGEWKVVDSKTCITDGLKERVCELCGYVDSAVDPSTGHVFGEPVVKGKTTTKTCSICGYSEVAKTVKDGVEKTLTSISGSLYVTGATASKNVLFEIGAMPIDVAAEYKKYREFDEGYVYRLLVDGVETPIASDMKLTLSIDAAFKDYDVSLVVLRGNAFYTLENYSRKGLDITIDGSELNGVDAIFVTKGEGDSTNIVVPIIIVVATLAIAGAAVYLIMSKNKNKGKTF